jgi:hypothetical protein
VVALGAAAFYLALSGGNVATERAFVMVFVMLVAVLADRRAISLRSVAIAALIILVLRPEALTRRGSRCHSPRPRRWWRCFRPCATRASRGRGSRAGARRFSPW